MTHRSVVFANLIIRASCAIIALAVLANAPTLLTTLPMTPGQTLVSVHLVFNTLVVFGGLMVLGVVVKVNERFQTAQMVRGMSAETLLPKSTLDLAVVGTPSLALACITREVLRMGAMVQEMVAPVLDEFSSKAVSRKQAIELLEQEVNKSFDEIRLYAAHASQTEMSKKETKQARELVDFSISLESAADRVVKIMLPLAVEKRELNLRFSEKGWAELNALHQHIMANMQTALNVLVSEDLSTARLLVEEKDNLSKRVRKSRKKHLKRLGSGEELSFDTSDIHLEALNALKDINSFFASVAYPILYRNNALRDSKLVEIVDAENKNDITI